MKEVFCETLDYIFLSDTWKIVNLLPVPRDTSDSYPDDEEPSDHFMIGATLTV
jgi:hypothetical protein